MQGCDATGPRVLMQPSDDLQAVPTEFKAVIGHSQTEPSSNWRGETVLWIGADEAPFALTLNKVPDPVTAAFDHFLELPQLMPEQLRDNWSSVCRRCRRSGCGTSGKARPQLLRQRMM